jgi:predicted nucleic acid-binding protein
VFNANTATALANDLPLFTRNPDDFDRLEAVGLQAHTV